MSDGVLGYQYVLGYRILRIPTPVLGTRRYPQDTPPMSQDTNSRFQMSRQQGLETTRAPPKRLQPHNIWAPAAPLTLTGVPHVICGALQSSRGPASFAGASRQLGASRQRERSHVDSSRNMFGAPWRQLERGPFPNDVGAPLFLQRLIVDFRFHSRLQKRCAMT